MQKSINVKKLVATTLCVAALTSPAFAAGPGMLDNDPKRPVAAIAADLNITADQFVACFNDVNPAPKGTNPTGAREKANKAILLPCLQEANADITNNMLDQVMDKYRPEGRVAGR
ncbi:hypothetical protein [Maritalea myrionectae]|uniref:hypothetical protein n=1 Tax=Maritalea myrionectae TaxID=454601 RepID=UPI0004297CC8|nr:hypothetical protein [Maritalea myrionectae]